MRKRERVWQCCAMLLLLWMSTLLPVNVLSQALSLKLQNKFMWNRSTSSLFNSNCIYNNNKSEKWRNHLVNVNSPMCVLNLSLNVALKNLKKKELAIQYLLRRICLPNSNIQSFKGTSPTFSRDITLAHPTSMPHRLLNPNGHRLGLRNCMALLQLFKKRNFLQLKEITT